MPQPAEQSGRDANGRLIVSQPPNLPVLVAVGAGALSLGLWLLLHVKDVVAVTSLIAFGAWFTWAWLEIFQGINYIRRIVGAIVMALLLVFASLAVIVIWGAAV